MAKYIPKKGDVVFRDGEELTGFAITRVDASENFRTAASLSPLQHHKQLRLLGAREKMLVEGVDSTRAAFEVRYESASQSTREYKRLFGQPPKRDVRARRLAG
jgi:AraC-like DNA-binding protein